MRNPITTPASRGGKAAGGLNLAILLALCGIVPLVDQAMGGEPAKLDLLKAIRDQKGIHTMLSAWAQDNDQKFPDLEGDANANFRVLFQAGLIDRESLFAVSGDGWCQPGKPDGDIGAAPLFPKALEPGELSIAYVAGLTGFSYSRLPMMISGGGPAISWITGVEKSPPKVIFRGPVVVSFMSGRCELLHPDVDGKIRKILDGKPVDIFSEDYGTNPRNIRLPAPLKLKE